VAKIEEGHVPPARSKEGCPSSNASSQPASSTLGQAVLSRGWRAVFSSRAIRALKPRRRPVPRSSDMDAEQVLEFKKRAASVYLRGGSTARITPARDSPIRDPSTRTRRTVRARPGVPPTSAARAARCAQRRASGECRVRRVALCFGHLETFHTNANVSGKRGEKRCSVGLH
jgi:hypothetical protein